MYQIVVLLSIIQAFVFIYYDYNYENLTTLASSIILSIISGIMRAMMDYPKSKIISMGYYMNIALLSFIVIACNLTNVIRHTNQIIVYFSSGILCIYGALLLHTITFHVGKYKETIQPRRLVFRDRDSDSDDSLLREGTSLA
jgi:phosphatidylserine synthase